MTSNASTNIENVNVAINTPLPKAIIVDINFCDSLKKRDNIQPISKGIDPMKPNTSDSNTPSKVIILDHSIIDYLIKKFLIKVLWDLGHRESYC